MCSLGRKKASSAPFVALCFGQSFWELGNCSIAFGNGGIAFGNGGITRSDGRFQGGSGVRIVVNDNDCRHGGGRLQHALFTTEAGFLLLQHCCWHCTVLWQVEPMISVQPLRQRRIPAA